MIFHITTIFPEFFDGPFRHGIVKQAAKKSLIELHIHDLRQFTQDRHKTVDDRSFGGGEGMVLKPEPIFRAVEAIAQDQPEALRSVVLLSPQGRKFNQQVAWDFAHSSPVILICGRYEGVDERVAQHLATDEISIGDFILSGGELAACVLIDCVTRLIPGVLNNESSTVNESFGTSSADREDLAYQLLDWPHYTRPEVFQGLRVPEVLLSGNHKKVKLWRRKHALEKTLKNRPDLIQYARLSESDKALLETELGS